MTSVDYYRLAVEDVCETDEVWMLEEDEDGKKSAVRRMDTRAGGGAASGDRGLGPRDGSHRVKRPAEASGLRGANCRQAGGSISVGYFPAAL